MRILHVSLSGRGAKEKSEAPGGGGQRSSGLMLVSLCNVLRCSPPLWSALKVAAAWRSAPGGTELENEDAVKSESVALGSVLSIPKIITKFLIKYSESTYETSTGPKAS